MLTDKTKEAFEKWFNKNYQNNDENSLHIKNVVPTVRRFFLGMNDFYNFPFSMQYGVMVDFFDENGISVNVFSFRETINTLKYHYEIVINGQKGLYENTTALNTLSEARKNAILKANNLFNENNRN